MEHKNPLNGWAFISKSISFEGSTAYFEVGIPTEYSQIPERLQEMADRGVPVPDEVIERAVRERNEAKALSSQRISHDLSDEQSVQ